MANNPEWLNPRSAAIPIMHDAQGVKVVLVTTKPNGNNWIFPKGQVEMGMAAHLSAAKEAFEEAGLIGQIDSEVFDQYQHKKWGGSMTVRVYLLEVTQVLSSWHEMHERDRKILPLEEAINLIQEPQKPSLIKLMQQQNNKAVERSLH